MKLRTSVTTVAVLGVLLVGCNGDSESADESGNAATETTATATEKSNDRGKKPEGADKRSTSKLTDLTKAELERARTRGRVLAQCLRTSGAEVSTDSNSPKSRVIKAGKGVVLRIKWGDSNGADVYVGGRRRNTRITARALKEDPAIYKRRILVVYDQKPSGEEKGMIEHCVSRDTV
jgi:hypothetical protein